MRVVAFLIAVSGLARAETPAERAAADTLFDDGRKLMASGDLAHACPKLAESMKIVPRLGTQLNLADCHARQGLTATAWAEFRSSAALAKQAKDADREQFATQQATALEPKLSRLLVKVADGEPAGLVVKRDGEVLDDAFFGSGIPVDPGPHTVAASAPGKPPFAKTVTIDQPGTVEVEVPVLGASPPPPPPPPPATAPVPPPTTPANPVPMEPPPPPPLRASRQRLVGLATVGVGAAVTITGFVIGGIAKSTYDTGVKACDASTHGCDPGPLQQIDDARGQATISTVVTVIGAAAIATGVVIWLTAPKARMSVAIAPGSAGAVIAGSW
jgi:hypothetical protein